MKKGYQEGELVAGGRVPGEISRASSGALRPGEHGQEEDPEESEGAEDAEKFKHMDPLYRLSNGRRAAHQKADA